jgi:hypothetical protein
MALVIWTAVAAVMNISVLTARVITLARLRRSAVAPPTLDGSAWLTTR